MKMSLLSAWAELQVASSHQEYLVNVVRPHIATLAPMWLASLREFARLRFEPDISMNGTSAPGLSGSLDMVYSALSRDVLLKVFKQACMTSERLNDTNASECLVLSRLLVSPCRCYSKLD